VLRAARAAPQVPPPPAAGQHDRLGPGGDLPAQGIPVPLAEEWRDNNLAVHVGAQGHSVASSHANYIGRTAGIVATTILRRTAIAASEEAAQGSQNVV
jgi:hypothetical protein